MTLRLCFFVGKGLGSCAESLLAGRRADDWRAIRTLAQRQRPITASCAGLRQVLGYGNLVRSGSGGKIPGDRLQCASIRSTSSIGFIGELRHAIFPYRSARPLAPSQKQQWGIRNDKRPEKHSLLQTTVSPPGRTGPFVSLPEIRVDGALRCAARSRGVALSQRCIAAIGGAATDAVGLHANRVIGIIDLSLRRRRGQDRRDRKDRPSKYAHQDLP